MSAILVSLQNEKGYLNMNYEIVQLEEKTVADSELEPAIVTQI